jgi:hypothetical protein
MGNAHLLRKIGLICLLEVLEKDVDVNYPKLRFSVMSVKLNTGS